VTRCHRSLDIAPLEAVASTLRALELVSVRVQDFAPLARLSNLERLTIEGGKIPDLEFLRGHPRLREVGIFGRAVVLSDDLSPLDDLPAAEVRYVKPRRTYNRCYDQIPVDDS
jgi:hypothetical protein